jgi:hypothetical protein
MPSFVEYEEAYEDGYAAGYEAARRRTKNVRGQVSQRRTTGSKPKTKRKLSAWNKFVKANSSKPRFRLRSGSPNLKKLGVAFRKTPAGKKSRR